MAIYLLLDETHGAANMYKYPKNATETFQQLTSQLPNITLPDEMPCFEYHYPVKIPFVSSDHQDPFILESTYISTGSCQESSLFFPCENMDTHELIQSC